jgi:acetoin utilization deacetylase AcuC-like enzyme
MRAVLQRGPAAERLEWHAGRHATDAEILRFHEADYLRSLVDADVAGRQFSATTVMAPGSLRAIRAAAGTALAALEHVLAGRGAMAYALVRPPGHHAAPAMADGYCFLNNAALAACGARAAGLARVAIIDWDVHHGNGTQSGFYARDDVLTVSFHMDHGAWGPSHREAGTVAECGTGAGRGYNFNLPLPMGLGDRTYRLAFDELVAPVVERFAPELIVIANGQDANQFDPNGRQLVTMHGFRDLARRARALADRLCDGRLVIVQEGGYNPSYAAFCAQATVEGFLGMTEGLADPIAYMPDDGERAEAAVAAIDAEAKRHGILPG